MYGDAVEMHLVGAEAGRVATVAVVCDTVRALLARGGTRRAAMEANAKLASAGRTCAVRVDFARLVARLAVLRVSARHAAVSIGRAILAVCVQAVGLLSTWLATSNSALSVDAHAANGTLVAVEVCVAESVARDVVLGTHSEDAVGARRSSLRGVGTLLSTSDDTGALLAQLAQVATVLVAVGVDLARLAARALRAVLAHTLCAVPAVQVTAVRVTDAT